MSQGDYIINIDWCPEYVSELTRRLIALALYANNATESGTYRMNTTQECIHFFPYIINDSPYPSQPGFGSCSSLKFDSFFFHSTSIIMGSSLNKTTKPYPTTIMLSHTDYGRHFHLGYGINIPTSPSQRLQSFVQSEGLPYRFVMVGQLMSFKVVEDPVCTPYLSNTDPILCYWESSLVIIFQSTSVNFKAHRLTQRCFPASLLRYKALRRLTGLGGRYMLRSFRLYFETSSSSC